MYDQNTLSKLVSAHGLYQRLPVTATDADTVRLDLVGALKEAQPEFVGLHLAEALAYIIAGFESDIGWHRISASWALAAWLAQAQDWLEEAKFFEGSLGVDNRVYIWEIIHACLHPDLPSGS